jgi:hypothetical protein
LGLRPGTRKPAFSLGPQIVPKLPLFETITVGHNCCDGCRCLVATLKSCCLELHAKSPIFRPRRFDGGLRRCGGFVASCLFTLAVLVLRAVAADYLCDSSLSCSQCLHRRTKSTGMGIWSFGGLVQSDNPHEDAPFPLEHR